MKTVFNLLLCMICTQLIAQPSQKTISRLDGKALTIAEVDRIVHRLMTAGKVDGMQLSIINDNKVAYQKAYGYSNKAELTPLDTNTVMYAASYSKAVFAFLVMHLVEDGTLNLDRPLYRYLPKPIPEYPQYHGLATDDRWKMITARMCLDHTTGLPNLWWMDPRTGEIDTITPMKLHRTPGTRYAYSGEALKLLQIVVEHITGRNLEQLAREKVFDPIGMSRTSYMWQPVFEENSAWGHDENGKPIGKKRAKRAGAGGSMATTIADYSRFITYILQGKGISNKTRAEMIRPQVVINSKKQFPPVSDDTTDRDRKVGLAYGLGWGLLSTPYGPAFFKEGHDDYWRNYNISFPDKGTSIIIMCNSANGEGIFKYLLSELIADTFTPWEWEDYIPYDMQAAK